MRNIPLERDFYDVILSAPGILSSPEGKQLTRSFSSHGGTVRSNQVAIDGINVNDPLTNMNRLAFSFDTFEEFEFELGAHPAEVGMIDGAYINIVTKSGGNKFHGEVSAYFFTENMVTSLIPESEAQAVGLTKPTGLDKLGDYNFSLGGPIVKDKLWFFTNGRYLKWDLKVETLPDGLFSIPHDEITAFAKLTFQPLPSIKLTGMGSFGNVDEPHHGF